MTESSAGVPDEKNAHRSAAEWPDRDRLPIAPYQQVGHVVAAKEIYEFQDFAYAAPCGENSFLEDYTAAVRGVPLRVIVLVVFNGDGKVQRLVVNHRPRSSVLELSRAMFERFAGTPLAKHWEGTP